MSKRAAPVGSAAAASWASDAEVSDAMAIFSPGLRRRRFGSLRSEREYSMIGGSDGHRDVR
ncbi:hypothetical protein [Streptomyces wuyuanensis]|uniref:hypothetical protein n=1 Tax=Streptomyces wuyuanensis TaxID=1196353 RepID=UPI0037101C01